MQPRKKSEKRSLLGLLVHTFVHILFSDMRIETIETFLKNWRTNALRVYTEESAKWNKMRAELRSKEEASGEWEYKIDHDMDWYNAHLSLWYSQNGRESWSGKPIPKPEPSKLLSESAPRFIELCDEINKYVKSNTDTFMHIITEKMGEIDTLLDKEVDRKREALITRVEKKAGRIVDASGLRVGDDGEINGRIKGEENTVNINTITAGGYNIQCLHYRLLVKVIK